MVNRGKIAAISISVEKGVPKSNVAQARLIKDWGIEGDAHAGNWHRQISLLAVESMATIRALGLDVQPGDFAENITTQEVDLSVVQVGDQLVIGDCQLEITQIGKVCHARCSIYARVGDCVMPREGLFARVVCGGTIRVGDGVEAMTVVSAASQHG
jgi:MOSC domain-containing protein YiiM